VIADGGGTLLLANDWFPESVHPAAQEQHSQAECRIGAAERSPMRAFAASPGAVAWRAGTRAFGRLNCGIFAALVLGGCSGGVLQPQGPIGGANSKILLDAAGIMAAIVVPTLIALVAFGWWFRAANARARYRPDFVYSGRLEIIVWAIPILVIMFLGGVIWIGSHELDPFKPLSSDYKPTTIQVVSLDWKWLFIYPDEGIASVNQIVVPAGAPVHFLLTSASVMNSFFVPQLGSMIATMNGMQTQLYLQADHPGEYDGLSTQYSGDGFSGMSFMLRAVPADAFAQWIATVRRTGSTLDRAAYMALAVPSQNVKPFTYRSVEQNLFHAVVTRAIPPGPGPHGGRGGASISPRSEP
jgi:cytochrome o ubiquinol oxidase subunit 2